MKTRKWTAVGLAGTCFVVIFMLVLVGLTTGVLERPGYKVIIPQAPEGDMYPLQTMQEMDVLHTKNMQMAEVVARRQVNEDLLMAAITAAFFTGVLAFMAFVLNYIVRKRPESVLVTQ